MEQKAQASWYRCQVTPLLRLIGRSDQCQGKNSTEVIKALVEYGASLSIPATEVESSSIMYRFACFFETKTNKRSRYYFENLFCLAVRLRPSHFDFRGIELILSKHLSLISVSFVGFSLKRSY